MEYDSVKAVTHLFYFAANHLGMFAAFNLPGFSLLQIKLVTESLAGQNCIETGVHEQLGRAALSLCFFWGLLLANKLPS